MSALCLTHTSFSPLLRRLWYWKGKVGNASFFRCNTFLVIFLPKILSFTRCFVRSRFSLWLYTVYSTRISGMTLRWCELRKRYYSNFYSLRTSAYISAWLFSTPLMYFIFLGRILIWLVAFSLFWPHGSSDFWYDWTMVCGSVFCVCLTFVISMCCVCIIHN